jgi:hypothetical protein
VILVSGDSTGDHAPLIGQLSTTVAPGLPVKAGATRFGAGLSLSDMAVQ